MEQQRVDHDGKVYGKVGPEDYEDGHMAEVCNIVSFFLYFDLTVISARFPEASLESFQICIPTSTRPTVQRCISFIVGRNLGSMAWGRLAVWFQYGIQKAESLLFGACPILRLKLVADNVLAPLLERLNMDLTDIVYNGTIWNEGNDILRSEWPSPESDVAWDRVTATKMFSISESEVRAMGRDPAEAVKLPSSWGRGGDLYGAYLDGQHMLHCLKEVRKMVYFQYYYAPHWGNDSNTMNMPYEWKAHTSHCIYLLLQSLRCQPSMAMNTLQYIDRVDNRPYIDGRTKRRCVNHEAILDWQEEQAWFTDDMLSKVTPGPDSIIFQKPPEPEEK